MSDLKVSKSDELKENPQQATTVKQVSSKVYNWASQLTTEMGSVDKFYETKFFRLLLFKIRNTKKGLIAISGLQGTGKTRLLTELGDAVKNQKGEALGFYQKWTRNWRKEALTWELVFDYYFRLLNTALENAATTKRVIPEFMLNLPLDQQEKIIGKAQCNRMQQEALEQFLKTVRLWLIDMPDYSKSNAGLMNADIDELQEFWELLRGENTHFVISVQKELVMKHPHFFWGKCDMVTLEPLTVDELIEAYRLITGDSVIFEDAALKLLAHLSRGVFRRFKKYVQMTIENNFDEDTPLKPEHVKKAITEKQLFEDMNLSYMTYSQMMKREGKLCNCLIVSVKVQ